MKLSLETERLVIRNFKVGDWKEVYEYTSNPQVMYFMPEGVLTEQETERYIHQHISEDAKKFAVVLKSDNQLIGHVEFFRYFGEHTYEIGWVMNPAYQHLGYMTEAAKALLNYGFHVLKLHRIVATCQPENIASYKVMEKIGMRKEGYFRKCIPAGEEWWDEYYYAVLAEDFQ